MRYCPWRPRRRPFMEASGKPFSGKQTGCRPNQVFFSFVFFATVRILSFPPVSRNPNCHLPSLVCLSFQIIYTCEFQSTLPLQERHISFSGGVTFPRRPESASALLPQALLNLFLYVHPVPQLSPVNRYDIIGERACRA